jgi:hypothetical protein
MTDNTITKRKKYKETNNYLQNTIQRTYDRATRTPLKTGGKLRCSGELLLDHSPPKYLNEIGVKTSRREII